MEILNTKVSLKGIYEEKSLLARKFKMALKFTLEVTQMFTDINLSQ